MDLHVLLLHFTDDTLDDLQTTLNYSICSVNDHTQVKDFLCSDLGSLAS